MSISVNTFLGMTSRGNTLMSVRGYAVLAASLTLSVLSQAQADIINANSVSLVDVTSAIALASDGDTVVVPAGTASWPSILQITKGITLQGADNDATVILDNVPRTQSNQGGSVIAMAVTPSQSFRLTGFTFRRGSLTSSSGGTIRLSGTCPTVRVDHCHFDQLYTDHVIQIFGWLYGVIDHCVFDMKPEGPGASIWVSHEAWGGEASGWGSWADPSFWGSEKFIFIEDNVINNTSSVANNGSIDSARGGRWVARKNVFNNFVHGPHGTDSGTGQVHQRGTRAVEIYNNTFSSSLPVNGGQLRGGTMLSHNNILTGTIPGLMALKIYRLVQGGPYDSGNFGNANGGNPWDVNATRSDGTHVDGETPYVFLTGTHDGSNNTGVPGTLHVTGAGWATDQWKGFSVTNDTTDPARHGATATVLSNTSNTMIMNNGLTDTGLLLLFHTGDPFSIRKVLIALDQPGRGQGDLIAGSTSDPVAAWPNQLLEPCRFWGDRLNGNLTASVIDSTLVPLRENVDLYNETANFNGTVGIGVGTLAQRPATCTTGTAYWATDQGEWDSTHEGPDGQLYVASATNTWTLFYTPYVYPHPLVSGVPTAPENLRIL
jgi:hypothetical protein